MRTSPRLLSLLGCNFWVCSSILAATNYVWQDSPAPKAPFGTWATAAHTIQEAVDAASAGNLILVTNGVYATGGRAVNGLMTNRVTINKFLTVQSVQGPEVTVIQGYQVRTATNGDGAVRCVYMVNGVVLSGFTLSHGATRTNGNTYWEQSGGGICCASPSALVTNCVLTGNAAAQFGGGVYRGALHRCLLTGNVANFGGGADASTLTDCTLAANSATVEGGGADFATLNNCILQNNSAQTQGGGASSCTLNNCVLLGNTTENAGGGAYLSTLNNCTLVRNAATGDTGVGGGAFASELNNSIAYYNTAIVSGANYEESTFSYGCTVPLPEAGTGTITNEPGFVSLAASNLRLQSNSPCINAGLDAYVSGALDLDGYPRISGSAVDIGAYEFLISTSNIPITWLQQYHLATDGSADLADPDGDRMNNWQEWVADTNPTDAASVLRVLAATNGPAVLVKCLSSSARLYTLLRATNLFNPTWLPVAGQTGRPGNDGLLYLSDPSPPPRAFYRLSVRVP
jgi:hypothetical protein